MLIVLERLSPISRFLLPHKMESSSYVLIGLKGHLGLFGVPKDLHDLTSLHSSIPLHDELTFYMCVFGRTYFQNLTVVLKTNAYVGQLKIK